MSATSGALVQFGCGTCTPKGWRNFDASPTLRLQRIPIIGPILTTGTARFPSGVEFGNVVQGLPLTSGMAKAVYCSHVLEHLSFDELPKALRETHRILVSGGIFRGVLPDLEFHAKAYVADASERAAERFMEETLLGIKSRGSGITRLLETGFGNSQHLWMWDYKGLVRELEHAGFKHIRKAVLGDSQEKAFCSVEEVGRWQNCLVFRH